VKQSRWKIIHLDRVGMQRRIIDAFEVAESDGPLANQVKAFCDPLKCRLAIDRALHGVLPVAVTWFVAKY
jgi:hypothetical protein